MPDQTVLRSGLVGHALVETLRAPLSRKEGVDARPFLAETVEAQR